MKIPRLEVFTDEAIARALVRLGAERCLVILGKVMDRIELEVGDQVDDAIPRLGGSLAETILRQGMRARRERRGG